MNASAILLLYLLCEDISNISHNKYQDQFDEIFSSFPLERKKFICVPFDDPNMFDIINRWEIAHESDTLLQIYIQSIRSPLKTYKYKNRFIKDIVVENFSDAERQEYDQYVLSIYKSERELWYQVIHSSLYQEDQNPLGGKWNFRLWVKLRYRQSCFLCERQLHPMNIFERTYFIDELVEKFESEKKNDTQQSIFG